jgi:hypothetical protein
MILIIIFTKMQKLLDFGVEKVIWIFTGAQKAIISTPNQEWRTVDWSASIEVMPDIARFASQNCWKKVDLR